MRHWAIPMISAALWLTTPDCSDAAVEEQTFVVDVVSLLAGNLKSTIGFLEAGQLALDIQNAPDGHGWYMQSGDATTTVVATFQLDDGVRGVFVAMAYDPKQADPMSTDPAEIGGLGVTSAADLFLFVGEELLLDASSN